MDLYSFVYRGMLAREAVAKVLPSRIEPSDESLSDIRRRLPLEMLEDEFVASAEKMSSVYVAIAAFESAAREFIEERLKEKLGDQWWVDGVSSSIRAQAESRKKEEEQIRWHSSRGTSMLAYVQLDDLARIIQNKHELFKELVPTVEWANELFRSLTRSRNVIMHSGQLKLGDVERVAMNIRDWMNQVGG